MMSTSSVAESLSPTRAATRQHHSLMVGRWLVSFERLLSAGRIRVNVGHRLVVVALA